MKKDSIFPRSGTWAAADHTRALGQRANNLFITYSLQGHGCWPAWMGISKIRCQSHGLREGDRLRQLWLGTVRRSPTGAVCCHLFSFLPSPALSSHIPVPSSSSSPTMGSLVTFQNPSFPSPGRKKGDDKTKPHVNE